MKSIPYARSMAVLGLALLQPQLAPAKADNDVNHIKVTTSQILFELVGEGFNLAPPASAQIGYFTYVKGVDSIFSSTPENETTALFTFYRDTANVRVIANGPMRIISRVGTTTVYFNPNPSGDLSNPDSFRTGVPVLVSSFRQQAIIDTVTQTFSIVDQDTITSTGTFSIDGLSYQIGKPGDVYRTHRSGHLNAPGSALAGWLGGYSVGAGKAETAD